MKKKCSFRYSIFVILMSGVGEVERIRIIWKMFSKIYRIPWQYSLISDQWPSIFSLDASVHSLENLLFECIIDDDMFINNNNKWIVFSFIQCISGVVTVNQKLFLCVHFFSNFSSSGNYSSIAVNTEYWIPNVHTLNAMTSLENSILFFIEYIPTIALSMFHFSSGFRQRKKNNTEIRYVRPFDNNTIHACDCE